jgi:hypothetical protein
MAKSKDIARIAPIHASSPHRALVAFDWADTKHDAFLWDASTGEISHEVIPNTPEALHGFIASLNKRLNSPDNGSAKVTSSVGVLYEAHNGPLSVGLAAHAELVLYPVNPKAAARFREAFNVAGGKNDPVDGYSLLLMGIHHMDQLTAQCLNDVPTRLLALLSEQRRKLVEERTRTANELRACLKSYFPQMIDLVDNLCSPLFRKMLTKWPTLEALQKASPATLRKFFHAHNCRRMDTIEERIKTIASAVVLTHDVAHVTAMKMRVDALLDCIATQQKHIQRYDVELAEHTAQHADATIFRSVPGAGACLVPRLIAAFGSERSRWAGAEDISNASGVSPIIVASGKMLDVQARYKCDHFLRQTFVELASTSLKTKEEWVMNFYQSRTSQGWKHNSILRAIAYKWQRILWKMWQERKPYDSTQMKSPYKDAKGQMPTLGIKPKQVRRSSKTQPRSAA